MELEPKKGMVIVYTGDGKGKTTAALGMCVRAVGHNLKICILQFVKGTWKYGELEGLKKLGPNVELHVVGKGCVGILGDKLPLEEHRKEAEAALELATEKINSEKYNIVILDEINVAVKLELIPVERVLELIESRPQEVTLVLTGRAADPQIVKVADLVTEMLDIKHPYQLGVLAMKGIDY
ncbi:MAG: cob(I)yrinic acid a c-diamide adenosyltransferase [candidate division Zixibacteria bacterium DG_27]|nr:MAG: cob(I)yrinic acid a c-diamide adenosyltransferase [candidate division Zixibacteria bacterium DG_27]